jgi:hypothetical protein
MRKYSQLSRTQLTGLTHLGRFAVDAVVFGEYPPEDELSPRLELTMIWYRGDLFPRIECVHDVFLIFDTFSDLFIELGKRSNQPFTAFEFCTLLDDLGFQDETPDVPWQEIHVTLQPAGEPMSTA